jgi:hypothetical protein
MASIALTNGRRSARCNSCCPARPPQPSQTSGHQPVPYLLPRCSVRPAASRCGWSAPCGRGDGVRLERELSESKSLLVSVCWIWGTAPVLGHAHCQGQQEDSLCNIRPSAQMQANGHLYWRLSAQETSLWGPKSASTTIAAGNYPYHGLLETSSGCNSKLCHQPGHRHDGRSHLGPGQGDGHQAGRDRRHSQTVRCSPGLLVLAQPAGLGRLVTGCGSV